MTSSEFSCPAKQVIFFLCFEGFAQFQSEPLTAKQETFPKMQWQACGVHRDTQINTAGPGAAAWVNLGCQLISQMIWVRTTTWNAEEELVRAQLTAEEAAQGFTEPTPAPAARGQGKTQLKLGCISLGLHLQWFTQIMCMQRCCL